MFAVFDDYGNQISEEFDTYEDAKFWLSENKHNGLDDGFYDNCLICESED